MSSNERTLTLPCNTGGVSDGYHTFDELYAHRHVLFINVVLAHRENAFKTWKDDKGETWHGWFILGINTAFGQVSYHLPEGYWQLVDVEEIERNTGYDGYTPSTVLMRLGQMASAAFVDTD